MFKQKLFLILNNIRSAYNVGSIFRTADAVGVDKIFLCGITPIPQIQNLKFKIGNDKIAKTALGAEKTVEWEYHKQTGRLLKKLKDGGYRIIALERFNRITATNKFEIKSILNYIFPKNKPIAVVVGNEVGGLSKKILEYSDDIVEIPMYGKKESLNVSVATGIALYKINEKRK